MKRQVIVFLAAGAVLYGLIPLLMGKNVYAMGLVVNALAIAGVALAWAMLGNLGGMVSFGHAAFFGVGAYVSAILSMKAGLPVFLAMLAGGLGATLASFAMLPALRLKGPYFALSILAYTQIFRILATEFHGITGGSAGMNAIARLPSVWGYDFDSKAGSYFVILTIVLVFACIYRLIWRSDYGAALISLHESEDAARVVGVNSTLLKALMLFLSAFMTGVIGAFNAHHIGFLEPDYAFGGTWIVLPIVVAIFGGYRTISGPLAGALAVYLIDQLLLKDMMPLGHEMALGLLLIGMIVWSPAGMVPLLSGKAGRIAAFVRAGMRTPARLGHASE